MNGPAPGGGFEPENVNINAAPPVDIDDDMTKLNGLYFEGPDGKVYLVKNDEFVDVPNTKYNSNK